MQCAQRTLGKVRVYADPPLPEEKEEWGTVSEITLSGAAAQSEFTEKKSRFISHLWPVASEEEARARIEEMRKHTTMPGTTAGAIFLREGGVLRYSDDGEPQGLRGSPC